MRKLILQEFVSLDGLAAGTNDAVDFVPQATKDDSSFGSEQLELMNAIDTILLGRVTYQLFAGYWPKVTEGKEKTFADKLNATRKVVVSHTLDHAPWGSWRDATIVKGDPAPEVRTLKQQSGKDIVIWGSISLAQSLMDEDLIDEYRLVMCPIVLGAGRPLFREDLNTRELRLLQAKTFDRGAVLLKYSAAKQPASERREVAAGTARGSDR